MDEVRVVLGVDAAQVEVRALVADASDDRRRRGTQVGEVVAVERHAVRRHRDARRRPGAGERLGRDRLADTRFGHDPLRPVAEHRDRGVDHPPERDRHGRVAAEVGERDVLQRSQHQPAGPQRPGQRMRGAGGDEVGPPGDDAGLRAAEQLVAAERHERGAVGQGLHGRRLAGQPRRWRAGEPRHGGIEQATADVDDHGQPERRQLA